MGRTTDRLLEAARALATTPPEALLGQLLATGEEASVALPSIALTSCGVNVVGLPIERFVLRTSGGLSDADPVAADTSTLLAALGPHDVVVLPGFVGRDASGAPSVLGRGGSDLTALFLADAPDATEVRLVKGVDGVYPEDPRSGGQSAPLGQATWDEVQAHRWGPSMTLRASPGKRDGACRYCSGSRNRSSGSCSSRSVAVATTRAKKPGEVTMRSTSAALKSRSALRVSQRTSTIVLA